jgi:hypothetical protein
MQGSDSGRDRRPPFLRVYAGTWISSRSFSLEVACGNLDLVPFLLPRGSLGHLTLRLVEDRQLVCGDLLALPPKTLVAKQSHVLAQLGDLGIARFELGIAFTQGGVAFFELGVASEKQDAKCFDRVRELLRDVHHDTYLRRCSPRYKVDS